MTTCPTGATAPATLIALDWGTTALRAYLLDARGHALETRPLPWGIMRLPEPPAHGPDAGLAGFELAFRQACGDWLRATPGLPVIACGMVGSAQGWREAPYLTVPRALDELAASLTRIERKGGTPVHIVPGLLQRVGLPNVMRGEETQVYGALMSVQDAGGPHAPTGWRDAASRDALIGLPGTHSKWVRVRDGIVTGFDTFMTGEVYAALREHTILGRTMRDPAAPDDAAFDQGLRVAGTAAGRAGVLSTIFSTRTLGLTGQLGAAAQADYLSGLLIGHEIAALAELLARQAHPARVLLCGQPELCRRYARALLQYGLDEPTLAEHATERGLWRLAHAAGLLAPALADSRSTETR